MANSASNREKDYAYRVNEVLKYIDEHLDDSLSLKSLSKVGTYSSFHFHRIFKLIVNEPLQTYIKRKRIEKATSVLFRQKSISISEIALKYGFNDHSSFTRAFKKYYGLSPSEFRNQSPNNYSKICQIKSKNGQIITSFEEQLYVINNLLNWMKMNAKIEVKDISNMNLAYVSHIGDMNLIGNAYNELIRWATPKGLMESEELKMLTIYHDSPKVTDPDKIRMSACMVLNTPIEQDTEVNLMELKPGKCIIGRFEITPNEFEKSWTGMFAWMNENGYKKSEKDPFEIYHNDFREHPKYKCIVDLCIPVE